MKYQAPKFNNKELLEIFPIAKKIIPEKIKELKLEITEKESEIKNVLDKIYEKELDEFSVWFNEKMIEMFILPDLKELERKLFRLNRFLPIINPDKYPIDNFQEQIENAREFPIYELARDKLDLKQAGRNFISLCPFHEEKTASFYLYTDSNKFHCYGCQSHGDVIELAMALYGIKFKEAIVMLQK